MAVRRTRKTINVKWVWWPLRRNVKTKLALYSITNVTGCSISSFHTVPKIRNMTNFIGFQFKLSKVNGFSDKIYGLKYR